MGEPATTAAPGTDNPPSQADRRTCRDCGETKVVSPESWPYRSKSKGKPYQAHGLRCRACEAIRKQKYDVRLTEIESAVGIESPEPPKGKTPDKDAKPGKLDVSKALKTGAIALNTYAASVMARVLEYADDPGHEHHIWALELLAQRILPRKLFEELGGQAAGLGALTDRRPQFVIQVLPAQPNEPAGRVIPGEVMSRVELLSAPGDDDETVDPFG